MTKAKVVTHHDDPPCYRRLNDDGFCQNCCLFPDTQSISLYAYCPLCDCQLNNLTCPICKESFENPFSSC